MANITVLDQDTINQIAAGEVIERPASVVKELLENAIDAGSTAVTIETKEGGLSLVRVTDNGCGIPAGEIPLAFLRHSTSKIRSAADLMTVSSLGFRGEALSSIAAVCQVELITKPQEALTGACYSIEGGQEKSLKEVGAPDGTTFLVRNLFYNTPARRKFLKAPATEGGYIADLAEKMALSHPEVSIRLIQNGSNKLFTTGNGSLKDLIYMIYGRDISANTLEVQADSPLMQVSGYIGKPVIARGNRAYENYFINGRYIRSRLISKAIEDAYKPFMMLHKYPFTVLHLTIEPELLDVNVHPTKMELRFKQEDQIYKALYQVLSDALSGKEFIPEVSAGKEESSKPVSSQQSKERPPEPFERKRMEEIQQRQTLQMIREYAAPYGSQPARESSRPHIPSSSESPSSIKSPASQKQKETTERLPRPEQERPASAQGQKAEQLDLFDGKLLSEQARSRHQLIGQLFDTYWLIQYEDKLFILDQHAAHEKVLYERTMKSLGQKEILSQQVSPPAIIALNAAEETVLKQYRDAFSSLGFELEYFGGKEYAISAVPMNLFGLDTKALFLEILDSLGEDTGKASSDLILAKVASMSCKAAVKGKHTMSRQEADALIGELLTLDNPYACPHGRPTLISMSRYELEKKFKRIV